LDQQRRADRQQGPVQLSLIRVLYVFAGEQRYADVRHWLTLFQAMRGYTLTMKEVDLVRGQDVHAQGFFFGTPSSKSSNPTAMMWPSLHLRATLTHTQGAHGSAILGLSPSETWLFLGDSTTCVPATRNHSTWPATSSAKPFRSAGLARITASIGWLNIQKT
jgi:hypothetical protein